MSKAIATDQGHWYDAKTGAPRYTIVGKNGKERNTTLRDARTLGLVPSVTTIVKVKAAPGLQRYFRRQMWEATVTTARLEGEADDAYFTRCCEWADEHAAHAAERGTALHGDMEKCLQGAEYGHKQHVEAVLVACRKVGVELLKGNPERSFAHPAGFGGRIDWSNETTVVDFKTKPTIKDGQLAYDDHVIQLSAYAMGLRIEAPRLLNVFIGIDDGKVAVVEHDLVEIHRGWKMFTHCFDLWKLVNNYDPAAPVKSVDEQIEGAGL